MPVYNNIAHGLQHLTPSRFEIVPQNQLIVILQDTHKCMIEVVDSGVGPIFDEDIRLQSQ